MLMPVANQREKKPKNVCKPNNFCYNTSLCLSCSDARSASGLSQQIHAVCLINPVLITDGRGLSRQLSG